MNRPTMLLTALLADAGRAVGVSTARDVQTIEHRIKHEGFSFLTITLPVLSDYLERGLETGYLSYDLGRYFRFQSHRSLPRFLGGFFRYVFNDAGIVLANPDPNAILAIRQVSRCFKKIFEVCDDEKTLAAARRYITIEEELEAHDVSVHRCDPILDQTASILGRNLSETPTREELVCRHGPGATADRRTPNGRLQISTWPLRAVSLFPIEDHAIPNWGCHDDLRDVQLLVEGDEPPVRVVFVPKTALTPRVIAIEPSHMQYMQQAIMGYMVKKLESVAPFRGHINFSDQSINQQLARRGSMSRWLATIDMKDASDRVHKDLAKRILGKTALWPYLEACRSRTATLPDVLPEDERKLHLRKFASQGSATCFPVEAYVFFCLIISAVHVHRNTMPTWDSVRSIAKDVWVYGDDIVVPSPLVDVVCAYLESFGLKVNRTKSFSKSHFRESCGADYYNGTSVKPVYFRQRLPGANDRWTPKQLMAWTSTSNQLYMSGYWESSQIIRDWITNEVGPIPRMRRNASIDNGNPFRVRPKVKSGYDDPSGLVFVSVVYDTRLRWSDDYQSLGWKVRDYAMKRVSDPVPTYSAGLFKGLKNIGLEHSTDFMFSTKRDGFTPKHRWVSFS